MINIRKSRILVTQGIHFIPENLLQLFQRARFVRLLFDLTQEQLMTQSLFALIDEQANSQIRQLAFNERGSESDQCRRFLYNQNIQWS